MSYYIALLKEVGMIKKNKYFNHALHFIITYYNGWMSSGEG